MELNIKPFPKFTIYKILKLSCLIKYLFSYLPRDRYYSLIRYNKKLQKMLNVTLYDYQKNFIRKHIKTSLNHLDKIELWNFLKNKYNNFNSNEDFEKLKKICDELIISPLPMNSKLDKEENNDNYKSFTYEINSDFNFINLEILKITGKYHYISDNLDYLNLNIFDNQLPNLKQLSIFCYNTVYIPISLIQNLEVLSLRKISTKLDISKLKDGYNEINLDNLFYLEISDVFSDGNKNIKFTLNNLEYIFIEEIIENLINEENFDLHFGFLKKLFGLNKIYETYKKQYLSEEYFNDLTFNFLKNIYSDNQFFQNLKKYKYTLGIDEREGYEVSLEMVKLKSNLIQYKYISKTYPDYFKLTLGILYNEYDNIYITNECEFDGNFDLFENYNIIHFEQFEKISLLDIIGIENENEKGNFKIDLFNNITQDNFILQEIILFGMENINKIGIINLFHNIKHFIFLRKFEIEIVDNVYKESELFILLQNLSNLKFITHIKILINMGKISENETKRLKDSFPKFQANIQSLEKCYFLGKQRILNIKFKK